MANVVTQSSGGVVVLFALEREASPFRRMTHQSNSIHISVTGVGRKRTQRALEQIFSNAASPACVIASGFCGALRNSLKVGDVVVAREVVDLSGKRWPADLSRLPHHAALGRILTVDRLIALAAEKKQLGTTHEADVVDMESAAVADACAVRGVPFLSVRAVSDSADTELSPELLQLLAGGRVSVWKAIRALLRKPTLLGEFRRLARDTRLAAQKLAEVLVEIVERRQRV